MSSKKQKHAKQAFDPSQGRKNKKISLLSVAKQTSKRIKAELSVDNPKDILKTAWVPASKLALNYDRQRWPEPEHIEKLCKKWKTHVATPLQCRYDKGEDIYYITDGQQHGIAWLIKHGLNEETPVLVCYVESDDETIETEQLLALNTDSKPMAKYFIHEQEVKMGVPDAVALENCVLNANCFTSYKKQSPGAITHITDLKKAQKEDGLEAVSEVLVRMRNYFPMERIVTVSMMGFLKVRELMIYEGIYDDDLFDEVFYQCTEFFEDSYRMYLDIAEEFRVQYPTNFRGMGVKEKMASGIIDVYEQMTGKHLVTKPFDITMPRIGTDV